MLTNDQKSMDKIVNLCKSRGFVYPGSEIYGGLANSWDYGPLGVELKNNIKRAWWQKFVQESPYNVGLDASIIMNPETWVASGHLGGFSDPLMDCKSCKTRHRADNLIEDFDGTNPAGWWTPAFSPPESWRRSAATACGTPFAENEWRMESCGKIRIYKNCAGEERFLLHFFAKRGGFLCAFPKKA